MSSAAVKLGLVAGAQLAEESSGAVCPPFLLARIKSLPVEGIGTCIPFHGNEEVVMGTALPLRLQDADETNDPCPIADQVAIPPPSELCGMEIGFICDGKEQTVIAAPMLDESRNVEPQMKRRLGFRTAWPTPPTKRVLIPLVPRCAFVAFRGEPSIGAGNVF